MGDLAPGTMVGDYRIDQRLGKGGMGTVYAATQPVIEKRVAIKVLHRHLCENARAVERFVQEARAVNRIGHAHIVDVFGFGTTADGSAFLVMELLVGESLANRAARAPLPVADACEILVAITHALEAAHAAGIVHRDLKPDNIYLAARGPVLLDFGIAKLVGGDPGAHEETRPGIVLGTPRYISPEQVRGQPLDGRTDVYALGVVAFELFTGRPPFTGGDDAHALLAKHVNLKPPRPTDLDAALPEGADALLGGMLEKDPAARPTLAEVRDALGALRSSPASPHAASRAAARAAETAVLAPEAAVFPASAPTDALTFAVVTAPARPRRTRWMVLGGVIAAIAIVAVIASATRGTQNTTAAPAAAGPVPATATATATAPATATATATATAAAPAPATAPAAAAATAPAPATATATATATAPAAAPVPATPPTKLAATHGAAKPKPHPQPKPVVKPVAPEDDDAVRSPFEKKP